MSSQNTTGELRKQVGELRGRIIDDAVAQPDMGMNGYKQDLESTGHDPRVVRTALFELMTEGTLTLQHPGNRMHITDEGRIAS